MTKPFFLLWYLMIFLTISCIKTDKVVYDVRIDFRFGEKFISLVFNEQGQAYAMKGHCTNYTEQIKIADSIISKRFTIDSVGKFYKALSPIKVKPVLGPYNVTDGQRTEIYYEGKKIYDIYFGNSEYWDLFKPIMAQIPSGYNPFISEERPFD